MEHVASGGEDEGIYMQDVVDENVLCSAKEAVERGLPDALIGLNLAELTAIEVWLRQQLAEKEAQYRRLTLQGEFLLLLLW